MTPPDVTVVLTCLDEADLVSAALGEIRRTLAETPWTPDFVVVDDGSTDRTLAALRALAKAEPDVRLVEHGANLGRGRAVADGLERARGRFAGYIDPDLEIPAASIPPLLGVLEAGADLAVGRRIFAAPARRPIRYLLSKGHQALARVLLRPPIPDTDAGIKFFRRDLLDRLLPACASQGWFWDTEVVVRAARMGAVVRDVPVVCRPRPGRRSTVEVIPTVQAYLRGLSILLRT